MKLLSILTAVILTATNAVSRVSYQLEVAETLLEPQFDYVYCSVDAPCLPMEIISDRETEFNGENCAEIFVQLLEENGYNAVYSGTTDEWFYLSAIEGLDTSTILIPDELKTYLEENNIQYTESVSLEGSLGEFDITDTSGWVFRVNGTMPSVGMCDYIPEAGDEIELIFTLNYGEDLQ